jgi:hypothetical protein
MNRYEELKLTAVKVNLNETFGFLQSLTELKKGTIKSEIPTINGLEIEFQKGERCIKFSTGPILSCEAPVQYQHSNYGINKPFEIFESENKYSIKNGAGSSSVNWGQGFSIKGELWELESNFTEGAGFFRAVFPIDGFTKIPVHYFLGEHFIVGTALRAAGYINVNINEYQIGFYDYDFEKQRYIFIECKNSIDYSVFEKLLETIIYSFAFISGSLIRSELTILKFGNPDFSNLLGFQFRKVEDSIISSLEIINPREHKEYENLSNTIYYPLDLFSKLTKQCYNNKPLLRAIRIITQAREQPVEIEAASIFVALETVKQIIIDENIEKISPFVNSSLAATTISDLKAIISLIPDHEFNDKGSVLRKLDNLNMVGNNDSFKLAFKLVGFNLTNEDEKCISMRNRFLHGNIPFENEPEQRKMKELLNITLNAHLLTCSLILKYTGYRGVIKNFLKYWDLVNKVQNDAPLFRKI